MTNDRIAASVVATILEGIESRLKCIQILAEVENVTMDCIRAEATYAQDMIDKVRDIYGLSREQIDDFDDPSMEELRII